MRKRDYRNYLKDIIDSMRALPRLRGGLFSWVGANYYMNGGCGYYIADNQYYSEEVFKTMRSYGAEPVIPHSSKVKEPLINLYVTKRFRVKGEKRLVELYKRRMAVERAFKAAKRSCRWRSLNGEA